LKVPDGSLGRRARCPACRQKFIIADPADSSMQTILGMVIRPEDASDDARLDE
jgi:hypothetical protein